MLGVFKHGTYLLKKIKPASVLHNNIMLTQNYLLLFNPLFLESVSFFSMPRSCMTLRKLEIKQAHTTNFNKGFSYGVVVFVTLILAIILVYPPFVIIASVK